MCSCKARLGSYNWAGSQTESGAWVTPAFQLHHSKIDAMSTQPAEPLNLRRPLFGSTSATQSQTSNGGVQSVSTSSLSKSPGTTAAQSHNANRLEQTHQHPSGPSTCVVPPIDATRTLSEAGHVAAQVDSELERPGIVPQTFASHNAL